MRKAWMGRFRESRLWEGQGTPLVPDIIDIHAIRSPQEDYKCRHGNHPHLSEI